MDIRQNMQRALQVLQVEGVIPFLRASGRKVLRRVGLYPELTLSKAIKEMDKVWPAEKLAISAGAPPRASIILLTYNNLEYTRLCLRSIYGSGATVPFEVILVDNASSDSTPAFLQQFTSVHPNTQLILNPTNLGFSGGNNLGVVAARGEVIVFLNNDTIVTPGWLDGLLHHLQNPTVGMVGPRTNFWGNESRIEVKYHHLSGLIKTAERLRRTNAGHAFEIPMLALYCAAIRREVFEAVGLLDERFGAGMFEDDDYAVRLKKKGFRILCAEDVFVHHWGKASFSKLEKDRYRSLFEENRQKFEEKWRTS